MEQERSERVAVLGRQLLPNEAETARIGRTHHMLRAAVLDPKWVATIVRRSGRFADRSAAHVRRSAAARLYSARVLIALASHIKPTQIATRDAVQDACLALCRQHRRGRAARRRLTHPTDRTNGENPGKP